MDARQARRADRGASQPCQACAAETPLQVRYPRLHLFLASGQDEPPSGNPAYRFNARRPQTVRAWPQPFLKQRKTLFVHMPFSLFLGQQLSNAGHHRRPCIDGQHNQLLHVEIYKGAQASHCLLDSSCQGRLPQAVHDRLLPGCGKIRTCR